MFFIKHAVSVSYKYGLFLSLIIFNRKRKRKGGGCCMAKNSFFFLCSEWTFVFLLAKIKSSLPISFPKTTVSLFLCKPYYFFSPWKKTKIKQERVYSWMYQCVQYLHRFFEQLPLVECPHNTCRQYCLLSGFLLGKSIKKEEIVPITCRKMTELLLL